MSGGRGRKVVPIGQFSKSPHSLPSTSQGTPNKRKRTDNPAEHYDSDQDMESIDNDNQAEQNTDSGGSVYRSEQFKELLSYVTIPRERVQRTIVEMNLNHFAPVLSAMYQTFRDVCYRGTPNLIPITEANFLRVARLCIKARVDFVYMRVTGALPPDRVNINQAPEMPKCLAEIVNGIGTASLFEQFALIVPSLVAEGGEQNHRAVRTPANTVGQFSHLVKNLVRMGYTTASPLSRDEQGTLYWLHNVRDQTGLQPLLALGDADTVTCQAEFTGSTPADIMLAAITQNQFNGIVPPFGLILCESDFIANINNIRAHYFTSK